VLDTCIFERTGSSGNNVTENRRIQINYAGTGNYSQFTYGPTGARVKIVETSGGSVTSTKQFVNDEERDGSGAVSNQFFTLGQTASGTAYFFTLDLLGSIREMTNGSGTIVGELVYDPFGRKTLIQGTVVPDFQFAGYYMHSPSGLSLTFSRPYNSVLGRFINRDLIGEIGGGNLYEYTNNPVCFIDPLGTDFMTPHAFEGMQPGYDRLAGSIDNAGCRGVVDSALNIPSFVPGAYLPEAWLPQSGWPTKCFWGSGNNPNPAAKAARCSQKCPPGSHAVIWCKQGNFDNPGAPGSAANDPAVNMRTNGENYNYSVSTPGGYQGADAPGRLGGQRAYSGLPQPYGGENYSGSVCCSTCVPTKGK
jgi:RHS repeat-associated protein